MFEMEQSSKKEYKRPAYTVCPFVANDILTGSTEETMDNTNGGGDKAWGGLF